MALAKDMAMVWAIIRVMAVGSMGVMVEQVTVIMVIFLAVRMMAEGKEDSARRRGGGMGDTQTRSSHTSWQG